MIPTTSKSLTGKRVRLSTHWIPPLLVATIILSTGVAWSSGVTWGLPYGFHSDEFRYLTRVAVDPSIPIWTIYGRWPIYFMRTAAFVTGLPVTDLILARSVTLLISLVGLAAVAGAAREQTGWLGATLATALFAGAPIVVQSANFFIADVPLYAAIAVTLWLCFRYLRHASWPTSILLGIVIGIGAGSKLSGLFLLPAVALTYLLSDPVQRWRRFVVTTGLVILITGLGQPTLWVHGLESYLYQGQLIEHLNVAAGVSRPVYTLQFANTPAWIYYLEPVLWWGAGPVLLFLGGAGAIVAGVYLARNWRRWNLTLELGCLAVTVMTLAVFYLMSAGQYSKYTRYALPLLPPLALLGAWLVSRVSQRLTPSVQKIVVAAVMLGGLLPGLAFLSIHQRTDTRLQAADWIANHIPDNSVICHEPDLGFAVPPIGMGGPAYGMTAARNYQGTLLDWGLLYSASDYLRQNQSQPVAEKPEYLTVRTAAQQSDRIEEWLATCNWIILSDRFADQFQPLNVDFAAVSRFYQEMKEDRRPDFHLVAQFRSLPQLLGWAIDDSASEMTLRTFDHPTIWIFQRR